MKRKEQQAELIYKLGLLLRPIQELIDYPDQQTPQTRSRACAKFASDLTGYHQNVMSFTRSEPGHLYDFEWNAIHNCLSRFGRELNSKRDKTDQLREALEAARTEATRLILSIPTEVDTEILEAHSPFQAYCKLKVFCEAIDQKIIWADPYMGAGLFHRYLNGLPDSVSVALVTKDRGNNTEYQSFLDISRIYANERGSSKYRLVVEATNHDRWMRCDDQLYHLGGSAKDAGKRSDFTITKLESTPANLQKLDALIAAGTELFGPSTIAHI